MKGRLKKTIEMNDLTHSHIQMDDKASYGRANYSILYIIKKLVFIFSTNDSAIWKIDHSSPGLIIMNKSFT